MDAKRRHAATAPTRSIVTSLVAWVVPEKIPSLSLLLGLMGVLPLVLLTPPFQVPDEQQHFYRAYQLSELGLRGIVEHGAAGAFLPSSLPELSERFLGSRAIHTSRSVPQSPLRDTLAALAVRLDPTRREFVDFTGAAFYSPLPYLPQVAAIAAGRQFGLGPLGLLYAARLVNGVTAVLIVAATLQLLPAGRTVLLVLALLPMVLFVFASVSPDAAVISTALFFTALAMRARFRGRWHGTDIMLAGMSGAIFCSLKPVYSPLLVLGLPAALRRGTALHVIKAHAALLIVALGATGLWLTYSSSSIVLPIEGTNLSKQLQGIYTHPAVFARTILNTIRMFGFMWVQSTIGLLGWLTVPMPKLAYSLPIVAVLASLFLPRPLTLRIAPADSAWYLFLLASSVLFVLIALYLYWSPVNSSVIDGVQGRYFLPLAGLVSVALPPLTTSFTSTRVLLLFRVIVVIITLEVIKTVLVVVHAYNVLKI